MRDPSYYKGREQTYLKHFFLEHYLEKVAYHIGWSRPEFVYVDGFAGPWRSEDGARLDTSFMIAIERLARVKEELARHGRARRIRCVFVEYDERAYHELREAVHGIQGIDIEVIRGKFEEALAQIQSSLGSSFSLTFIDPTGWTGFALQRIAPFLRRQGEVLINFMFDHINRFRSDTRAATAASFDELFGGSGWSQESLREEEPMLEFYQQRLKLLCNFDFATRTRILKPLDDRTYFYLVYATRHPKGLEVFRSVEQKFLREQERVRADASQTVRFERSGQRELFRESEAEADGLSQAMRRYMEEARASALALLHDRGPLTFESLMPHLLQVPLVHASAAKNLLKMLSDSGQLRIDGMRTGARLPHEGCVLHLNS